MNLSSPPFETAAPSRPSPASRASRSGTSTSQQPLCAPTHRSSRSSIDSGNRSRPARSRFAWRRSIRRKGPPMPIVGWSWQNERTAGHPVLNPGRQVGEIHRRARRRPSTSPGVLLTGAVMIIRKPCSRRIATSSAVAPVAQGTPNSLQAARTRSRFSCTAWIHPAGLASQSHRYRHVPGAGPDGADAPHLTQNVAYVLHPFYFFDDAHQ